MAIGKKLITPTALGVLAASAAVAQNLPATEAAISIGAAAVFGALAQTGEQKNG